MKHRVIDITTCGDNYDIISQTPGNYNSKNYYLKELQDKVDAEWNYRPNRVNVEYENDWGNQTYSPIEVVAQSVKNDKGTSVSEDIMRLVFRDISEKRFKIGSRFRYGRTYDLESHSRFVVKEDDDSESNEMPRGYEGFDVDPSDWTEQFMVDDPYDLAKDVWITVNRERTSMTSAVVVQRCNGLLGSTYVDKQGVTKYHYEPVIQSADLSGATLYYNQTAVSPQSSLTATVQYNDYTRKYKVNQRFVIGARYYDEDEDKWVGQVYRIKAINRFYSNSTNFPEDVGTMKIYMEVTETSVYDDFKRRIAYQQDEETIKIDSNTDPLTDGYALGFSEPAEIPQSLGFTDVKFVPVVTDANGKQYPDYTQYIETTWELENRQSAVQKENFVELTSEDGSFTVKKKRAYLNGDLVITCTLPESHSPTSEKMEISFKMVVRTQS